MCPRISLNSSLVLTIFVSQIPSTLVGKPGHSHNRLGSPVRSAPGSVNALGTIFFRKVIPFYGNVRLSGICHRHEIPVKILTTCHPFCHPRKIVWPQQCYSSL